MAQIFLLFTPMTQESIWPISMPNSVITVSRLSNAHTLKTHTFKRQWDTEILLWSFKHNKSDIKFNFVLNNSHRMQTISSISFIILGRKHFYHWQSGLILFCFLETIVCSGPSRFRFSIVFLCFGVLKRCLFMWFDSLSPINNISVI